MSRLTITLIIACLVAGFVNYGPVKKQVSLAIDVSRENFCYRGWPITDRIYEMPIWYKIADVVCHYPPSSYSCPTDGQDSGNVTTGGESEVLKTNKKESRS
jgi:hypothetical protein